VFFEFWKSDKDGKKVFVKDLNNIVKQHDIKNIGVVLNSSKSSNGSYGYGYEY